MPVSIDPICSLLTGVAGGSGLG